jgi:hypothetical protein
MRACSRLFVNLLVLLAWELAAALARGADLPVIPTPKMPVTNMYHGVVVVDEYQWLENAADPAVENWTRAQNERTHAWFSRLKFRAGLKQQLAELVGDESASYNLRYCRKGILFATRFKPPAQQPVLVRLKSIEPPALRQTVFDPNAWNTNGTTAMDWFVPSTDGKLVAISLSENGSEDGTLHFFDTATGEPLPDVIPGVQYPTAGGSAAWNADGSGIFIHVIRSPANARQTICIFISKFGFTNSARRSRQTLTNWAAIFHASPKSNWPPATTAPGCWRRWPTGMAAISNIFCARRMARGISSRISRTASRSSSSAGTTRFICSRRTMRRAEKSCGYPWPNLM